jgi:hypothetical protein
MFPPLATAPSLNMWANTTKSLAVGTIERQRIYFRKVVYILRPSIHIFVKHHFNWLFLIFLIKLFFLFPGRLCFISPSMKGTIHIPVCRQPNGYIYTNNNYNINPYRFCRKNIKGTLWLRFRVKALS